MKTEHAWIIATASFCDEGPMYWNNEHGWTAWIKDNPDEEGDSATLFKKSDIGFLRLPIDGYWIPLEHAEMLQSAWIAKLKADG